MEAKKNFIYNFLLALSNIIYPIVTFPYVTRILGPEGVGKVQFITTFGQYFVLISALGIPIYGIREIAKNKNSEIKLRKTFSELLILNVITTLICTLFYFIFIFSYNDFRNELLSYFIGSIILLTNFSNVDWFFSGIEKFKFIAVRSIIIKLIGAVAMFVLVKKGEDAIIYLGVVVFIQAGNNLWNFLSSIKYFSFNGLCIKGIYSHIKPLAYIFSTVAAISVYSLLDTIILGFLDTYKSVGYYVAAIKINKLVIPLLSSLSTVLIPKMSHYIEVKDIFKINELVKLSTDFVWNFGIPVCFGLAIMAPEIIDIFSGRDFYPSIFPMRIYSVIVLIIGLSNIWAMQILTPFNHDKKVTFSVIVGLFLSLILNLILIPKFSFIGATLANLLSEIVVMLMFGFFASKVVKLNLQYKTLTSSLFLSTLFIPLIIFIRNFFENSYLTVSLGMFFCIIVYVVGKLFIFKDTFFLKLLHNNLKLNK